MSGWMSSYITQITTPPTVFLRFLQNFAHMFYILIWKKIVKQIFRIKIFLANFSNFELRRISLSSSVNNLMSQNY